VITPAATPPTIPGAAPGARCPQCGGAIPPTALSCHACHALVHADRLKTLADAARSAAARGDVAGELEAWRGALDLLPPDSSQFRTVGERVQALSRSLSDPAAPPPSAASAHGDSRKMWSGGAIAGAALLIWKFKAVGVFLLTKGKLLLFGLSKGTTFFSMLAALGVYWTIWGWKFALGFVLSIYIHEMGHVAAMRRFGMAPTAPMFIPGFGAVVRAQRRAANPQEDARIGLGGPIWGLGAAGTCFLIYTTTQQPYWAALTHAGAMINLFNLMPIWGLDGDHAFKPLNRTERWIATGVVGGMLLMTGEGLLVLIAILAAVQAFRQAPNAAGDRTALIQFAGLVAALSLLMKMPVPGQP
jgi:Zn-dependent protease